MEPADHGAQPDAGEQGSGNASDPQLPPTNRAALDAWLAYDGSDTLLGYAVSRKLGAAKTDWYWYEVANDRVYADGTNVGLCASCHGGASAEHTFVIVR